MDLTQEDLRYLQDLLDQDRANRFNYYMETIDDGDVVAGQARSTYLVSKGIREKLYRATGRDPLALAPGYHEQREDQKH